RTEQRHDSVTTILVNRALVAVNALRKDLEEPIHDAVPFLGVELGGELRRSFDIGEQDRHLLALALKSGARRENLLRQVTWCVRQRRRVRRFEGWRRGTSCPNQRSRAFVTEFSATRICGSASGARHGQ